MRLRGAYEDALAEFALPSSDTRWRVRRLPAALALTEQGDVLRIRGKFDEAESAYGQAAELGYEPQPGLVLTWTLRGRTAACSFCRTPLAGGGADARSSVTAAARCCRGHGCGATSGRGAWVR